MSNQTRRLLVSLAFTAAALLAVGAQAAGPPRYQMTLLPDVGQFVTAKAINNKGDVTGTVSLSASNPCSHAAFVYRGGRMKFACDLWKTSGVDINDRGVLTGNHTEPTYGWEEPYIYEKGKFNVLGSLHSFGTYAKAINNRGDVVGYSVAWPYDYIYQSAFLYSGGKMVDLLPGNDFAAANSINEAGEITGFLWLSSTEQTVAFVYSNGRVRQLPKPDIGTADMSSRGVKINNRGDVAGTLGVGRSGQNRPFLYRRGVAIDLGTLSGGFADASSLNDAGQVVGSSLVRFASGDRHHAFIHTGGRMYDLNHLTAGRRGFELEEASDINNAGQIVGNGVDRNGRLRAFLLTPIPRLAP
jgi:probable HAF family extracellular repeat protein